MHARQIWRRSGNGGRYSNGCMPQRGVVVLHAGLAIGMYVTTVGPQYLRYPIGRLGGIVALDEMVEAI